MKKKPVLKKISSKKEVNEVNLLDNTHEEAQLSLKNAAELEQKLSLELLNSKILELFNSLNKEQQERFAKAFGEILRDSKQQDEDFLVVIKDLTTTIRKILDKLKKR